MPRPHSFLHFLITDQSGDPDFKGICSHYKKKYTAFNLREDMKPERVDLMCGVAIKRIVMVMESPSFLPHVEQWRKHIACHV